MLKILIKNRLAAMMSSLTKSTRGAKHTGKTSGGIKILGFALLMLYCFGAFAFLFGLIFQQLAAAFHVLGVDWLYFTMAFILSFTLMFIGSIFTAKSQLYEATDNALLLSLPIRPGLILASRMVTLLIVNVVFELIVLGPAGILYFSAVPSAPLSILFFILLSLLLPFFSVAISGLFGWLLAAISARIRHKSLFAILFSVLFLLAYFYFYSNANKYISSLITNGSAIADALDSPNPLFWIGAAVAEGDTLYFLLSALALLLPFLAVYAVLSATFLKITTANRGFAKIKYQERALKAATPTAALFQKDMRHFLSSPGYLMNSGIGAILALIMAVFLLAKPELITALLDANPLYREMAPPFAAATVCFLCSTVLITAPAISIEGNYLWIVKSMPLPTATILRSKLLLHFTVALPSMILAAAALLYVIRARALVALFILITVVLFTCFTALLGLAANLKHPKMDYISETAALQKQSIGVLVTMLTTMLVTLGIGAFSALLVYNGIQAEIALGICSVLLAIICILLGRWVFTKGAVILEAL